MARRETHSHQRNLGRLSGGDGVEVDLGERKHCAGEIERGLAFQLRKPREQKGATEGVWEIKCNPKDMLLNVVCRRERSTGPNGFSECQAGEFRLL